LATLESCRNITPYGHKNLQYGRPINTPITRKDAPRTTMFIEALRRKKPINGSYLQIINALPVAANQTAAAR